MIEIANSNHNEVKVRVSLKGNSNYLTIEELKELKKRIDEFIIEEGIE